MKDSLKVTFIASVILVSSLILGSCVSYESETEGTVGTVGEVAGVKVLVDSCSDTYVAVAVRNDNLFEVEVDLRPVGGEIGYDYYSGSGVSNYSSQAKILAAWINDPSTATLAPGEELVMYTQLKNWYKANKSFKTRVDIVVYHGEIKHRISTYIDQYVVFEDPKTMFQENKIGKYDPTRYGARNASFASIPTDYELSIP